VLNISEEEQQIIFHLIASVLHLSNLSFQKGIWSRNTFVPYCTFQIQREMELHWLAIRMVRKPLHTVTHLTIHLVLQLVAELLQVQPNMLELALCNRNMSARAQSVYTIPLQVEEVPQLDVDLK
jgi:hypothetical protein